ncbi:MAG: ABC transporter substrate-binding protein [Archaeoglobaceae archaeon]
MKAKKTIFLLFIPFILTLSGCIQDASDLNNSTSPENFTDTTDNITESSTPNASKTIFVDDYGYSVQINETPDRVVSLSPSNTEILYALGLNDSIVAVTDYCNYPPEAEDKPTIGGYTTVNVERVISMDPDLVVAAHGNGRQVVETLKRYVTVYALNPQDLEDVKHNIRVLGEIADKEENASEITYMMEDKVEEVREEVQERENRNVTVAHIIWHDPIWASGKDTFIDQIISIAGGENVFNFDGFRIVNREELLTKNPEVIIVNGGSGMGNKGEDIIYQEIMTMDNLKAVKKGNVYVINSDIVSRPSYRLVYALEKVEDFLDKST